MKKLVIILIFLALVLAGAAVHFRYRVVTRNAGQFVLVIRTDRWTGKTQTIEASSGSVISEY